jgi:hypothetical protein
MIGIIILMTLLLIVSLQIKKKLFCSSSRECFSANFSLAEITLLAGYGESPLWWAVSCFHSSPEDYPLESDVDGRNEPEEQ